MKTWYLSKTLWLNVLAAIALLLQTRYGFILDPEAQAGLLTVINIILRLVTKAPLDWATPAASGDNSQGGFISMRCSVLADLFLIVLVAAILCSGCATTSNTAPTANDTPQVLAGKSLLAAKSTILVAATSMDRLCKAGTMPIAQCLYAESLYENIKPDYDAAVDAYLLMTSVGGDSGDFDRALLRVKNLAGDLLAVSGGAK